MTLLLSVPHFQKDTGLSLFTYHELYSLNQVSWNLDVIEQTRLRAGHFFFWCVCFIKDWNLLHVLLCVETDTPTVVTVRILKPLSLLSQFLTILVEFF